MSLDSYDYEIIIEEAQKLFKRWTGVRNQTVVPQDSLDYWVMVATERHIRNQQ